MLILQENISLKPYNTFDINVKASYFAEIFSVDDLQEIFRSGILTGRQLLVLGGGSNILFTKDFDGLVLKISIPGMSAAASGQEIYVTAGAGVVWNELVGYCVNSGYAGMENLSLIPGTVGASPVQNIGAYGVELMDVFDSCEAFELATGNIRTFRAEDCGFTYRDSVFKGRLKGQYIITQVTFRLAAAGKMNTTYGAIQAELDARGITVPSIADVSAVVCAIRVSKLPDPSTIGNAGSFFKNPVIAEQQFREIVQRHPGVVNYPAGEEKRKLAAGWLIEQCGFKGITDGQTGTWKNQALVLVNHGHATGQEVYSFSEKIMEAVYLRFGVRLEREVNIL